MPLDPPLKIINDGLIVITDGIGQHKVVLLINHNHNKIFDILGWRIPSVFLLAVKKVI